jgi:hypothetical protein
MILLFQNYTETDLITIERQIKSNNLFIRAIVERCKYGYPKIVLLDPSLQEGSPVMLNYQSLSNLMWLTCPYLNNEIHELENEGYIKKISDFINNDNDFKALMKSAHANFYFLRNYIYWKYVKKTTDGKPMDIFTKGIGGIRELDSLKCLHVHFCHYSIYKCNVAGHITYRLLDGKVECSDNSCCKNS